jgi:hypothetical protein
VGLGEFLLNVLLAAGVEQAHWLQGQMWLSIRPPTGLASIWSESRAAVQPPEWPFAQIDELLLQTLLIWTAQTRGCTTLAARAQYSTFYNLQNRDEGIKLKRHLPSNFYPSDCCNGFHAFRSGLWSSSNNRDRRTASLARSRVNGYCCLAY